MLLTFPSKESLLRKIQENPFGDSYLIIANFKSLAGWNLIPLRPLTVLLGPNSAGKSSLYDAFNIFRLLNTSLNDPGEFKTLLSIFDSERGDSTKPVIGFSIPYEINLIDAKDWLNSAIQEKINIVQWRYKNDDEIGSEFFSSSNKEPIPHDENHMRNNFPGFSKVLNENSYYEKLRNKNYSVFFDNINFEEFSLSCYFDAIKTATLEGVYASKTFKVDKVFAKELMPNINYFNVFKEDDLYGEFQLQGENCAWPVMKEKPLHIYQEKSYDPNDEEFLEREDSVYGVLSLLFQLPISGFIRKMEGLKTSDVRELSSDWMFCKTSLNGTSIESANYAENSYEKQKESKFPLGIFRSEITRKIYDLDYIGSTLHKLNFWLKDAAFLGTQYQLKIDLKACISIDKVLTNYSLKDHIKSISDESDPSHKFSDDRCVEFLARGYLIDSKGRELSFDKVGTGFTQVIPILADLSADETLMYKQPEVHLHPKLQSKVADCFVELINKQRNSSFQRTRLIETHSEHFVLRILKRLRKSFEDELLHSSLTVYPQDLAIIYFKPEYDHSTIYQIRVTESGGFIDKWPEGFFDERDEDLW